MSDTTETKLRDSLAQPEQATTAGRRAFVAIIWVSVAIGLAAHASEADSVAPVVIGAGIALGLAVWLHAIFRIQDGEATTPRTIAMVVGALAAFVALIAIDATYLVVLFGLYTLVFVWTHDDRVAIALSFAVTVCWIGAWLYHDLPTGALATPVFVWATLVAIQQVQSRVVSQSKHRRDLLEEVHRTREELAASQRARGVLEERERVAAEIHDTLAQGFTSIVLLSEATKSRLDSLPHEQVAESLALVEQTARENLTAARRLVEGDLPAELDGITLIDALHQAANRFEERTGASCELAIEVDVAARLAAETEVALLRVSQEALANAAKYAMASSVVIELTADEQGIRLVVRDDGGGFDLGAGPTEVAGVRGGQGLGLMRKRMEDIGGSLRIDSVPGKGTIVTALVPPAEGQR